MQEKRGRLIVGWRQVPVQKVRLRPVRAPAAPRGTVAPTPVVPQVPEDEKD